MDAAPFNFNLNSLKSFFAPSLTLTIADADMVSDADAEYSKMCCESSNAAADSFDGDALDQSRFRLLWALSHSGRPGDNSRALHLLSDESIRWGAGVSTRDRRYLAAVAAYNAGDYLRARELASATLAADPECRQAASIKTASEDRIAKDGLVGLGLVGAGIAIIGGIAAIASTSSSSRR